MWTGFNWFKVGITGGLLWTRQWNSGFHKRRWISWLSEWLLASQEGLYSVSYLVPWLGVVLHYIITSNYISEGKGKVAPVLSTEHHPMKAYWGSGDIAPPILDLDTRWRWVVRFTPRPIYLRESVTDTHWIGGWVGPTAVLVRRKIPSLYRDSNSRSFSP
jgi:hypothetical protein